MINQQNAKDYLPIVQAMAAGKTIQTLRSLKWRDVEGALEFCMPPNHYRVKPEPRQPRRWWVNVYPGDHREWHTNEGTANINATEERIECIEVVEVLKDQQP